MNASVKMGAELLELCNKDPHGRVVLNMARDFPRLKAMAPSPLLIPLQESLIANIPTAEVDEAAYKPFPVNAPRIISACPSLFLLATCGVQHNRGMER